MAKSNEIIPQKAIDGIVKTDTALIKLDNTTLKFISTVEQLNTSLKKGGIDYKALNTAQKKNAKTTKELTQLEKDQIIVEKEREKIRQNGIKLITRQQAKEKELIATMKQEEGSINNLNRRNKELGKLRNAVNLSTKKGQAQLKKYNKELDKNNAIIKKNKDALSQQKIGIGAYSAGIQNAAGQMGIFGAASAKTTAALSFLSVGFKTLRGAIMSTGIGALVIAFVALIQYFKSTEEGAAKLQKILAPFKILFGNITDVLADFGETLVGAFENPKQAISDLWTAIKQSFINRINATMKFVSAFGDILQGIWELDTDKIKASAEEAGKQWIDMLTGVEKSTEKSADLLGNFVKKIAKETREETKQQLELIDAQLILDKRRRKFLVDEAKTMTEISKLRLLANDDAADTLERQKAIGEALRLTEQLANERMANEKEQLRIMKLKASFSKSDADTLNAIAQKERDIVLLKKTQFDASRMMVMKQTTINNKLKKQLDLENEIVDVVNSMNDDFFDEMDEQADKEIETLKETIAEKQRLRNEEAAKEIEIAEETAELKRQLLDESISAAFSIYQGSLDRQTIALQTQRENDLLAVGEDKEAQAKINEKYDKKEAAIKTKKAKADKFQAMIDIAIDTARAIAKANPVIPLMVLAGAIGAVQLAAVAAQPIPKFFKGTESAPDGLISVGEKGRELIETKSGQRFMANSPTITSGLKGAKIYTNKETEQIMRGAGYDSIDLRGVVESNNRIEKAIKNIPQPKYNKDNRTITERKGKYFKTYLNVKMGSW